MAQKTQTDVVAETMQCHGGYATLGYLYQNVPVIGWRTKTPFASIRRIVQQDPRFFKIKPGLWALKSFRSRLPDSVLGLLESKETPTPEQDEKSHYYYQGVIVELGNLRGHQTYVPAQDGNRLFLERKLSEVATMTALPQFTYPEVVGRVKSVDAIWFNERKMPHSVFEVEHSTDFLSSFAKFSDLVDFRANLIVVAAELRRRQFESILTRPLYSGLHVDFWSYDALVKMHSATAELRAEEARIARQSVPK